ncbi:hypothetical protein AB0M46_49095 [Dactylosporangium sp. NPDC051485]|uniref:restriction system modified-DNA reader domain-containing protein n=1 Tax=Dactylosporangium sp. NPDC051485 TaxID=3154846 RepID=UPI003438E91F
MDADRIQDRDAGAEGRDGEMRQIDIDEQVYASLRELGRTGDTFNDVLRGVLGLPPEAPVPPRDERRRRRPWKPALRPLLAAGLLQPGQRLTWDRPRLGEQHTVTVDTAGNLVTEHGRVCPTPDSATRAITGYPAAGWPAFHTGDGVSLQQLRERLADGSTSDLDRDVAAQP